MHQKFRDLSRMFYPLSAAERETWAAVLSLPESEYLASLETEARRRGLGQRVVDGVVQWEDSEGRQLMLLFRLFDPGDLGAVRRVYATIAENEAPLAYTFVQQLPDCEGTWDIFHMSKLTYLAHCNRVSGPGSGP